MKLKLLCIIIFGISLIVISGCVEQENTVLERDKDEQTGRWGYINLRGRIIIPYQYEYALNFNFNEGLAFVKSGGKWGCIDKTGQEVIPMKYDGVASDELMPFGFSDGIAIVCLDGKWGGIDKDENEVIPFKYDRIMPFSEGLAVVCLDDKYGFIDKTGEVSIPIKYDNAESFKNGLAKVAYHSDGWSYFFINKTATEECTSLEMEIIWNKLLSQYFKQITDYRSKLYNSSRSSADFKIKRPYLHIVAKSNNRRDVFLTDYSEYEPLINLSNNMPSQGFSLYNISDEQFIQAIDGVKTIVVEYYYVHERKDYTVTVFGQYEPKRSEKTVTSYGSYLIYFDAESKKCIGFDNIHGVDLPKILSADLSDKVYANSNSIRDKIKSHLENPPL